MDDPRLDENFSFLFVFKKGDAVARKDDPSLRGEIKTASISASFLKLQRAK